MLNNLEKKMDQASTLEIDNLQSQKNDFYKKYRLKKMRKKIPIKRSHISKSKVINLLLY